MATATQAPLARETAARAVADRLADAIQRGVYPPGTHLRQNQLAAEFGVSTTPVREAFALLRSQGILQIDPHRGAIVFGATAEEIAEAYEIRGELEVLAALKALPHLTDELLDAMRQLANEMCSTTDGTAYLRLNYAFHDTLYRASRRPRLCSMIETLRVLSTSYLQLYQSRLDGKARVAHYDRVNREHERIVDACRGRDAKRLESELRNHLTLTVESIVAMLDGAPAPVSHAR
jgi:DNA-binding GntR family transcriptional regulator